MIFLALQDSSMRLKYTISSDIKHEFASKQEVCLIKWSFYLHRSSPLIIEMDF